MKQMEKINEAVGMKNRFTVNGGGKRLVRPFGKHKFWKFIGCVISAVTYGEKEHKLWSEISKRLCRTEPTKLQRYFREHTDVNEVCCDQYPHS